MSSISVQSYIQEKNQIMFRVGETIWTTGQFVGFLKLHCAANWFSQKNRISIHWISEVTFKKIRSPTLNKQTPK